MSPATPAGPEFRHGRALLAFSALLFGAMAVCARAASSELAASQIVALRFGIGLIGVAAIGVLRPTSFRASRWGLLALRGLTGAGAVFLYFTAIQRLGAGLGTLLNYTFPLWAALFGALVLGERVTARLALGFLLATAGLTVAVGGDQLGGLFDGLGDPSTRLGLIAGLVSSVLGGASTVAIRALRRTDSALAVFGAFCAGGLAVCLPLSLADWRPMSTRALGLVLLVGLFSLGAQLLFTFALKFVTAGAGSLMTQLTVVSSFGIAWLALGEPLTPRAMAGSAVVLAGVLVSALGGAEEPPSPDVGPALAGGPKDRARAL
jgi:drug/metabolite transporter (DMT)-like permease